MRVSVTVECGLPAPVFGRRVEKRPLRSHLSAKPESLTIFSMNAALQTDDTPYRKFMCVVCGWIYDEAQGWPDDGIAPGTRWEDIPETWTCPDCGVTKSDFEMMEI